MFCPVSGLSMVKVSHTLNNGVKVGHTPNNGVKASHTPNHVVHRRCRFRFGLQCFRFFRFHVCFLCWVSGSKYRATNTDVCTALFYLRKYNKE